MKTQVTNYVHQMCKIAQSIYGIKVPEVVVDFILNEPLVIARTTKRIPDGYCVSFNLELTQYYYAGGINKVLLIVAHEVAHIVQSCKNEPFSHNIVWESYMNRLVKEIK